jgi:D-alanine-D-alanine ligase
MTGHSLVPIAARGAGISYEQLCTLLVAAAALEPVGRGGKPASNDQEGAHA